MTVSAFLVLVATLVSQDLTASRTAQAAWQPPSTNVEWGASGGDGQHFEQLRKLFSRVHRELEPWKDGITLEMVEQTYCTDYDKSFRLQIINGSMYTAGEMTSFLEFNRVTKLFFLDVAKRHKLPDVDIVFSSADGCPGPTQPFNGNTTRCPTAAPLFSYDKKANQDSHCVLFPDFTFGSGGWPLAKLPSWEVARDIMDLKRVRHIPWEERIPQMFFRGAPTGNREELIRDTHFMNDSGIDFQLTGWTGLTRDEEYVSMPEHCRYRYLLNLPGNGWAVRLKYLMLCGSTIFFPSDGWEEFWYDLLEDRVNVVMVPTITPETRGADLLQALRHMQIHSEEARKIGFAGWQLIRHVLTPDNVRRYFAELLRSYAALQKFTPTLHPDAKPLEFTAMGPDMGFSLASRNCSICAAREEPVPADTQQIQLASASREAAADQ